MTLAIRLDDMAAIKKINDFACKCDFDVYVHSSIHMMDAKSILGLTSLVGRDDLRLVFPDHFRYERVEKAMKN